MATLRQLEVFVAVAEYKKISVAAKKLYISQPTVSQIISNLEEEYKVELFERNAKELRITQAGRVFLSGAQEIISNHKLLDESMKNIHSIRPLRIGATLTIGNTMMSSLVEKLIEKFPDIDVYMFVDNTCMIEQRMIHNELDIALVEGIIMREEIMTQPVIEDHLKIICGMQHSFAKRDSIDLCELENQNFIMREKGSGTRAIFENILLTNHIPVRVKWECSSGTAIIDAVRHNIGLGVLSERCFKEQLEKNELHGCSINDISMKRYFNICYNKRHPISSQMQDFIEIVKESQSVGYNCSI